MNKPFLLPCTLSKLWLVALQHRSNLAGLGVLTKGPIGFLLPGLIILLFLIWQRDLKALLRWHMLGGFVLMMVLCAAWYLPMYLMHGQDFIDTFFGVHNGLRATVPEHPRDDVWYYYLLIFLAGLQNISEDLYEAASLDGANSWQKFVNVTLPGLRNTTIFVIISTTIAAFGLFTQVSVMTAGGPADSTTTVMYHAVRKGFREQDIGYGSTISVVYFLVILAIAMGQKYYFDKREK